ncbi:MAG: sensor histidine kinase [Lachnospiraceae bacterium]
MAPLLREINYQNDKIAKQIEELKQKQREFALISDNMSEGLLIVDKDTDILSINRSMQKFFGAQGDIIGESALRINRSEVFRDVLSEVLNGSHVNKILTMNKRYYEITANPVFTNEVLDGAVILAVDITEKEERDKLRREFSSNVSHELKTPLSSIYGVSDMMMNGMVKPEDVKGFAKDINDEANRLIALVNDIIKLSQLDEGNIPVEKEPVDLFEMAKDVVKRLQPEAQKKQVQLNVKGETAKILGIGQILNEMLYNIVENAIKYNREEGSVDITVEDGSLVKVEVADTGIGIEPQYQERVFERFFRVDKSHSKKLVERASAYLS